MPATNPDLPKRAERVRAAFRITREHDPRLIPILVGIGLLPVAAGIAVGLLVGPAYFFIPLGVIAGGLAITIVFGRRFQRVAYAEFEGKPGAAASMVQGMRGSWLVTPAVQVNRNQDLVHRVVGRPGVVLLAEGRGRGVRELLGTEAKRVRRVSADVPIHDVVIGNGDGEVTLRRLQRHLMRLPRTLKPAQVKSLDQRLRALSGTGVPLPKGPLPTRMPRGKMR
ncbi:MAG: DUF4191 domain-containing protein [Mycobacteriales bacterium]